VCFFLNFGNGRPSSKQMEKRIIYTRRFVGGGAVAASVLTTTIYPESCDSSLAVCVCALAEPATLPYNEESVSFLIDCRFSYMDLIYDCIEALLQILFISSIARGCTLYSLVLSDSSEKKVQKIHRRQCSQRVCCHR